MTRLHDRLSDGLAKVSAVVLVTYAAAVLALYAGVLSPSLI
ncbi:hypothetical protein [Zavarzinia sp. CC-PAN008]